MGKLRDSFSTQPDSSKSISKVSSSRIKSALGTTDIDTAFDMFAQVVDGGPAVASSVPPPMSQALPLSRMTGPLVEGGWTKRKLANELRKLRSIGLSDEDAVNKVIEMGAAGQRGQSPIFRELARSLYWQTVPTQTLTRWLQNRSAQFLRCNCEDSECERLGIHVAGGCSAPQGHLKADYVGGLCDNCAARLPPEYLHQAQRLSPNSVDKCRMCGYQSSSPICEGCGWNKTSQKLTGDDGQNPAGLGDSGADRGPPFTDMEGTGKIDDRELMAENTKQAGDWNRSACSGCEATYGSRSADGDVINFYSTKKNEVEGSIWCEYCLNARSLEYDHQTYPPQIEPEVWRPDPEMAKLLKKYIGKRAQTAPPQGQPPTVLPEQESEDDRPLEELLQDLADDAAEVKNRVEQGESILHGQDVVPDDMPDTGAAPAPTTPGANPQAVPISKLTGRKAQQDEDSPEEMRQRIEEKKWRERQLDPDTLRDQPGTAPSKKTDLPPVGQLKGLTKEQLRKLTEEQLKKDFPELAAPKTEPEITPKWIPSDVNMRDPLITKDIEKKRLQQAPEKERKTRLDFLNTRLEDLDSLLALGGFSDENRVMLQKERDEVVKELHSFTEQNAQKPSKDPAEVVWRQFGPKYESLEKTLVGRPYTDTSGVQKVFTADEAKNEVAKMFMVDVFSELANRDVPQVGRGKFDVDKAKTKQLQDLGPLTLRQEPAVPLSQEELQEPLAPGESVSKMPVRVPGQSVIERSPDVGKVRPYYKGTEAKPAISRPGRAVKYQELLSASLPGIPNVSQYVRELPKAYRDVQVKDKFGKPLMHRDPKSGKVIPVTRPVSTGIDFNQLTDQDVKNIGTLLSEMMSAYDFNQKQIQMGMNQRNKQDEGRGKPHKPEKKGAIDKEAVDYSAIEYWIKLFDNYGAMMVKDRTAAILDSVDDVVKLWNTRPSKALVATAVNLLDQPYTSDRTDDIADTILKTAELDPHLASAVDKILLDKMFSIGDMCTHVAMGSTSKLGMMHLALVEDKELKTKLAGIVQAFYKNAYIKHEGNEWVVYSKKGKVLGRHPTKAKAEAQLAAVEISKHKGSLEVEAQKMKLPKDIKPQHPDQVKDVLELEDTAEDAGEYDHARLPHLPIKLVDQKMSQFYCDYFLEWDPKSEAANQSSTGVLQALRSFIKGLESNKNTLDQGFLGKISPVKFDMDAGEAVMRARTDKPAETPSSVRVVENPKE